LGSIRKNHCVRSPSKHTLWGENLVPLILSILLITIPTQFRGLTLTIVELTTPTEEDSKASEDSHQVEDSLTQSEGIRSVPDSYCNHCGYLSWTKSQKSTTASRCLSCNITLF
jgi:predicted Zn-ribbon and HTH transcriptional regulator